MYETVKVVNGHEIVKMNGTKGFYHVTFCEGNGAKKSCTFRTIKAAAAFCATF